MRFFWVGSACECNHFPIGLVEVTAADRAAATFVALGNEPLRPPVAGTSPFRGGFAGSAAKGLPPQRELSAARLTEDKPLPCSFLLPQEKGVSSTIRRRGWSPFFCGRRQGGFRLCGGEAVDGARLAAFRSPPPPLRFAHFDTRS